MGKFWYDLVHVWYLEPKTLVFYPMNFISNSKNSNFLGSREGKLYSRPKIMYFYYLCISWALHKYSWLYMAIYRKWRRDRSWRSKDYTTTWRTSGRELLLFWYLWSRTRLSYNTRQALVHLPPPCCFKIFITLFDALGDRSCVINNWCISFLGKSITLPWYPSMKRIFMMLSLALEKQNIFVLKQNVMLQIGWEFL